MIYDLTVRCNVRLRIASDGYGRILPGIQLRGTCRQVYEESSRIFWRNQFLIYDICKTTRLLVPSLTENLREVSWTWLDYKKKDPLTFRMFRNCKNLQIFRLGLTEYIASPATSRNKLQRLHQEEPAVSKFKRASGFDDLLSMRGLKTVRLFKVNLRCDSFCEAEMKAFESFLNQQLTQPKQAITSPVSLIFLLKSIPQSSN